MFSGHVRQFLGYSTGVPVSGLTPEAQALGQLLRRVSYTDCDEDVAIRCSQTRTGNLVTSS